MGYCTVDDVKDLVKEDMYTARRRQKLVHRKLDFCKLCIGHQLQFFDNPLRQLPQSNLIGHQVALHKPQFLHQPQSSAGICAFGSPDEKFLT